MVFIVCDYIYNWYPQYRLKNSDGQIMTYFFELIQPYIDNLVTLIVGSISTILFYRFKIRKQDVEVTAAEFSTVKDISDKYLKKYI